MSEVNSTKNWRAMNKNVKFVANFSACQFYSLTAALAHLISLPLNAIIELTYRVPNLVLANS